jgi:TIR domain-containing protein/pentapeptide repeat protein
MANSEHLAKLTKGVKAWNKWRAANVGTVPDLREADLITDLRGADLSGADLRGASLITGNLKRANFCGADLRGTDFTWANLSQADLRGADLTGASIGWTTFGDNDLSDVKGLEAVQHVGPSTIGIDTIYSSHGKIPPAFLRGAGVPENFIEYMGSLTGKALEFYSCFISHSTKDQEFADRLYADLQNKGVRCWFAPHDIQGGEYMIEQIDNAIRMHERLLLILSRKSMKSDWVETEIVKARMRERTEKKRVLFPVRLVPFRVLQAWECFDSDTGEDLAREIRKHYIPDFSDWKNHDSYAQGLKKLLGGLEARRPKAGS